MNSDYDVASPACGSVQQVDEQTLQQFISSARVALSIKDTNGCYQFVNKALHEIIGRKPEHIIGQSAYEVLPPPLAAVVRALDKRVLDTGRPTESEATITYGGATHSYYLRHVPLINSHGQVYAVGAAAVDITEHKQAQDAIQQQQELSTVLRERDRLARDIDATIGTMLGRLEKQSYAVQEALAKGAIDQAHGLLADLLAMIKDGQHTAHSFSLGISTDDDIDPGFAELYHDRGFFPAMQEYLRRYAEHAGIDIVVDIPPYLLHEGFPSMVQIHLLHIIHEALNAARQYRSAQTVRLNFALHDRTLRMTIANDWQHAPPVEPTDTARRMSDQNYTVRRMSERVREVGGTVEIRSTDPEPVIQVYVPLRRQGDLYTQSIKVMVASHQPALVRALQTTLTTYGLHVVGTAHSTPQFYEQVRLLNPDIALIDATLPPSGASGITLQMKTHHPATRVIVVSETSADDELFEVIRSGAAGYLPLDLPPGDLISLLLGLQRGEMALPSTMVKKVLETLADTSQATTESPKPQTAPDYLSSLLSPRQMEVLWLVAQDYTYREVGEILGFSERTIKHYMSGIIKQLQLQSRAEAIALVRQRMNHLPPDAP
jgi:two-component system NarL family response regulator